MFPIEVTDFESQGVTLAIATDPDFDARAQAILAGYASPVLALKPFLAIVSNYDSRTVVAYTVGWTVTRRNGFTEANTTQFKFPDAVAGTGNGLAVLQGREIRTGEERLVGMGFEVWPVEYVEQYREFGEHERKDLGDVKGLQVSLDAVIFDDGTLLGPDNSRLAEHFIAYVQAKQALYRDVVVGLETRGVDADVFAGLRETAASRPNLADPMGLYPHQAAAEILGWRDRILLEVFRRALRREAFTVKRQ